MRRLVLPLLLALGAGPAPGAEPAQGAAPARGARPVRLGEYEAKAAFLFNITRFAEWPKEALPEAATPLLICVFGEDPFGPVLDEIVRGETSAGHPLAVRRVTLPAAARECHVLFCGAGEQDHLREILRVVAGRPVLTVGETASFLDQGGAVALRVDKERIAFDVDVDAASEARVKLSSKLLRLASNVRERGRQRDPERGPERGPEPDPEQGPEGGR